MKLSTEQELALNQLSTIDSEWRDAKIHIAELVRAEIEKRLTLMSVRRSEHVIRCAALGIPKLAIANKGLHTKNANSVYEIINAVGSQAGAGSLVMDSAGQLVAMPEISWHDEDKRHIRISTMMHVRCDPAEPMVKVSGIIEPSETARAYFAPITDETGNLGEALEWFSSVDNGASSIAGRVYKFMGKPVPW